MLLPVGTASPARSGPDWQRADRMAAGAPCGARPRIFPSSHLRSGSFLTGFLPALKRVI